MNQHINSKNIVSEYNSIISSFSDNWNGNYKDLSNFLYLLYVPILGIFSFLKKRKKNE